MSNLYVNNINCNSSLNNTSDLVLNKEESKKMTGYASIDRPNLQYFDPKLLEMPIPEMTMFEYLKNNSSDHLETSAIKYFGNSINYEDLLKKIEKAARAYSKLGIKKGDVVAFCVPTIPESVYSLYALNMLGATSCWIDPRTGSEMIKKSINASNANILVTIDLAIPKINKIVDSLRVDKVISVSPLESLPYGMGHVVKGIDAIKDYFKNKTLKSGYLDWSKFVKEGDKSLLDETSFDKEHVASIVFTSGTSSDPKGVMITDNALNSLAHQYKISGISYKAGDNFLNVMPMFLLYGLSCGVHMPLNLGFTDVIIPQLDFNKMGQLVLKHQPKVFMINPKAFDSMISSKELQGKDLSHIISAGVGGSKLLAEAEMKYTNFLEVHNSFNPLGKGYGLTEGGSAVAATLTRATNKFGSVGVALPKNNISVFKYLIDEENNDLIIHTDEELKYGEEGEICVTGPTIMKGYLNNQEKTNQILRYHQDGKLWLHTSDRGYIDEDGNIFVIDRIGRMIIRPDSHNVYLASIENVISKHQAIKECCVVGVKPENELVGKYPKAVIVLKDEYLNQRDDVIEELSSLCRQELQEREVPHFYEILPELPIALSGKVDYKKLENEINGYYVEPDIKVSSLVKKMKK